MIEVPACAEHFKYLQRYFKKRFWHVLLLLPLCPGVGPQLCQCSSCVECFAHFLVESPKGKFNFKCGMRAAFARGVWAGAAASLERVCVLLGKCQKPLVKKPYGNYSTQLNMKCGKGSERRPSRSGGRGNM